MPGHFLRLFFLGFTFSGRFPRQLPSQVLADLLKVRHGQALAFNNELPEATVADRANVLLNPVDRLAAVNLSLEYVSDLRFHWLPPFSVLVVNDPLFTDSVRSSTTSIHANLTSCICRCRICDRRSLAEDP